MSANVADIVVRIVCDKAAKSKPKDPYYEYRPNKRGQMKRRKRPLPACLDDNEKGALKKIRKWAHRLDKGINICGIRVGYSFFLGLAPGAGDAFNAYMGHRFIIEPAKRLGLPDALIRRLAINITLQFLIGLTPFIGDVAMAAYEANCRNSNLIEKYVVKRAELREATPRERKTILARLLGGIKGVTIQQAKRLFLGSSPRKSKQTV